MREGLSSSPLLEEARHLLRERVTHYTEDRFFAPDIENAIALGGASSDAAAACRALRPTLNHRCSLYLRREDLFLPATLHAYLSSYKNYQDTCICNNKTSHTCCAG